MTRFQVAGVVLCLVTWALPCRADGGWRNHDEEGAVDETPEGCLKPWLCFKPPTTEQTHPQLEEKKLQVYLATAVLGPLYSQWVMTDAEKAAQTDDDLRDHLLADVVISAVGIAAFFPAMALYVTIVGIPLAVVGYLLSYALLMFLHAWVRPITHIHIINRAVTRAARARAQPRVRHERAEDLGGSWGTSAPQSTPPPTQEPAPGESAPASAESGAEPQLPSPAADEPLAAPEAEPATDQSTEN